MPDANQSWLLLLQDIFENGKKSRPRGIEIKELLCKTTIVDMASPIVSIYQRKMGYRFLAAEAWWILTGRNDVDSIKKYSPHIASFSDDGYRFDGAYGPRIVDQLRYVVDALCEDLDTRQAVLEIWRPNPRKSRDVPCTLTIQWFIRDGKLHCIDSMRSSDAWLGWVYDVFNFSMLSAYIALMLGEKSINVELGELHLVAGSSHLYVRPKDDGAKNIPYCLDDVNSLLRSAMLPKFLDQNATKYDPLDLCEFESPRQLIQHLSDCKDGIGKMGFMSEFQK